MQQTLQGIYAPRDQGNHIYFVDHPNEIDEIDAQASDHAVPEQAKSGYKLLDDKKTKVEALSKVVSALKMGKILMV